MVGKRATRSTRLSSPPLVSSAMDNLVKQRTSIQNQLKKIQATINKHPTEPISGVKLSLMLERLGGVSEQGIIIHNQILSFCKTNAEIETQDDILEKIEDSLLNAKSALLVIQQSLPQATVTTTSTSSNSSELRLPRLELPTFNGNLSDWLSFHDLFVSTVHNNTKISPAQKLTYLRSLLTGDAAKLIKSIPSTDLNYDIAWKLILERFQNKRELFFSILQRLTGQPTIHSDSAAALRSLIDVSKECVRSLEALQVPVDTWDGIIVFTIVSKLDSASRQFWELSLIDTEIPVLKAFWEFLEQRARALAAGATCNSKSHPTSTARYPQNSNQRHVAATHHIKANSSSLCRFCKADHFHHTCPSFKKMTIAERRTNLQKLNLCFNCLRDNHRVAQCTSKKRCQSCNGSHHTLIHLDRTSASTTSGQSESPSIVVSKHCSGKAELNQTMLATALIKVLDRHGQPLLVRALLDPGSTSSFVSQSLIQKLGLHCTRLTADILGLGSTPVAVAKSLVTLMFTSYFSDASESKSVAALVVPRVTSRLPLQFCNPSHWSHLAELKLADPNYHRPADVDVLLGTDIFWDLLEPGIVKTSNEASIAVNSILGWLVAGNLNTPATKVIVHFTDVDLDKSLQRFWEIESIPKVQIVTADEKKAESHFLDTYSRNTEGRFMVNLPFKSSFNSESSLGSSRDNAVRRLQQLERRLSKYPGWRAEYIHFMREYSALGHMSPVPASEVLSTPSYYIPHHFVLKESSTTTKFRVVFDASAKSSSGVSLNECLLVGPTIQQNLICILMRFRIHIIAFTADLTKFYRQILLNPSDIDMQRIVWRENPTDPVRDYRLLTATYGTASAPYHATKVLHHLAELEKNSLPLASAVTSRDFYVDDVMSGASTVKDALELQSQLLELMRRGGLDLRKWSSNSPALLESIPVELRETQLPLTIDKDESVKTLGLRWCPGPDQFIFKVRSPSITALTKRKLLSEVAKLFDPLGWLAPVVIKAKIMIQDLWKLNIGWDEPLPEHVTSAWITYSTELHFIERLKIDRCIIPTGTERVSLLGFCDASEKAFAAVVYVRSDYPSSPPLISLITAKTRVAPAKQVSLPRLELCGALLLAELMETTKDALHVPIDEIRAWTDSTVVLAWIQSSPCKWKTFVANRVTQIQELLPATHWSHVSGLENPADCASRGIYPSQLLDHSLWWHGPVWASASLNLTCPDSDPADPALTQEEKAIVLVTHTSLVQNDSLLNKVSTLRRLKAVTAWCLRFMHNFRVKFHHPKNETLIHRTGPLSVAELDNALIIWIKTAQQEGFPADILSLEKAKDLPSKSRLSSLNPFLDSALILRVGGRLRHAPVTPDQKNPILLPRHHRLTELIIINEHVKLFHAGPQLSLSSLQRRFWIINARDAVRLQIRKCVICTRHGAQLNQQFMGDLPAVRVTPSRAFLKCGVDYAGPFLLKSMTARSKVTIKAYVALFICFVTRAIHLEVVSSLTTSAFLAALKRFFARRGKSSDVFSDCGTNFVGAARELKELLALVASDSHNNEVTNHLADEGIQWHFNPPGAPHFGGLWEAGVKSIKYHLIRVIGSTRLNFEEFSTVLAQIESCVNSRPLTPASSSADDLSALTPGHFLIGAPLTAIPEPDLTLERSNHLSRWQTMQQLLQHFWRRWSQEFLSRLQQRPKWLKHRSNLKMDDMVLIRDERLPPLKWRLGRIINIHPGPDGIIRVVTLRTSDGEIKRPIVKLCLLPIDPCVNDNSTTSE